MTQEDQAQGLTMEMSQDIDFQNVQIMYDYHITRGLGIWAPIIVQRQEEKDYLTSLALILGVDATDKILLDGVDKNTFGTPPTFVRIPYLT